MTENENFGILSIMSKKTSPTIANDIISQLQFGVTRTKIAERFNVNRRTVWAIAKWPERYLVFDKLSKV